MKKGIIIGLILFTGLTLVTAVYAGFQGFGGFGPCLSNYSDADLDVVKKFQKDTLPLRDELITKRIEVRKEYAKETPDLDRIAALKKEIVDIKTQIQKKAAEAGLPVGKCRKAGPGTMKKGLRHGGTF